MSFVEMLKVIVLGMVVGFTEWRPISSTGHMILVNDIIKLQQPDDFYEVFEVVIQLGAIMAVVLRFFYQLWPFGRNRRTGKTGLIPSRVSLWIMIIAACLPAAVIGFLLDDLLNTYHVLDIDYLVTDNIYARPVAEELFVGRFCIICAGIRI